MPVFKRPGAATYSYDFRFRGRRFSGSTGRTSKREAEAFERQLRDEARRTEIDTSKPLNFGQASSQFWFEVGQYRSDPDGTQRNLAWLQAAIGNSTMICDISNATVARIAAKRRGETIRGKPIANGTVNRSVIEPLRSILLRAAKLWSARVQTIEWKDHKLREPQERVREASVVEEQAILDAVPADYRPFIRFSILTGCRRGEITGLTWTDVNFFAREFRVTGKGDRSRTIPMTQEIYDLLWALKDDHRSAVFTFKAARTRDGRIGGQRYPITAAGLHTIWVRYVKSAVTDFRFHDTRHTAATRLVRTTGNIRLAQRLLGHADVATTARYAHVTHDDLRKGLEAVANSATATDFPTKTDSGRG